MADPLAAFDSAAASDVDALASFDAAAAAGAQKKKDFLARRDAIRQQFRDAGALPDQKAAFVEPTVAERVGSSVAHGVAGVADAMAGVAVSIPEQLFNIIAAAPRTAIAAADVLRRGGTLADAFRAAKNVKPHRELSELEAAAATDAAKTIRQALGVRQGAMTDVGDAVARTAPVVASMFVGGERSAPVASERASAAAADLEGVAKSELSHAAEGDGAIRTDGSVAAEEQPTAQTRGENEFDADAYVREQTAKREVARATGAEPRVSAVRSLLADAKAKLVDSNAPIEDVVANAVRNDGVKLRPSAQITNQIDRVYRAPSMAAQFMADNGLEGVIRDAPDIDKLDQYLIAKHAATVEENGISTGRDLDADKQLVAALAPEYEPLAAQIRSYSNRLLDYSADAGLLRKDVADQLKAAYPDYVPLQRVFSAIERGDSRLTGTKAVASLSSQSVIRSLSGSERQIESPLESLLNKTVDAFAQGERNKAARMLVSYQSLPGNPFRLRRLENGEAATNTISFLAGGSKVTYSTTKEVADAAKALNVQQLNILGKILAAPVRLAKVGITGVNVPFIAANLAKDQVTAAINSDAALRTSVANPANFVRALFEAVKHGPLYDEVVREGGLGTSFDIARDAPKATVEQIRASRSLPTKIAYTVRHPSQLFRAVEDIVARGEEATRIQQYIGKKQAAIADGLPERQAQFAAAKAARENTVNFARRGEWGTVLNSAFLYLNAGIQGNRTLLRTIQTRPASTAAKLATTTFLPIAAITAWNMKDPARRAAYDDIAAFEKENNMVIVPPNPTKDERGRWNVIKIPLSQEINNIANVPRRAIEAAFGADPVQAGEVAKALIGTVSPVTPDKGSILSTAIPQAIKPAAEVGTNKIFFTGRDIVPDRVSRREPQDQVLDHTSGTARLIGRGIASSPLRDVPIVGDLASPPKTEAFVRETFGGVGSEALNAFDRALAAAGEIPPDQVGGESISEGTSRRFTKAFGGELLRRARDRRRK